MNGRVYQVNLQPGFGGGEVYTGFFTRALASHGIAATLCVHPRAGFWPGLLPDGSETVPVSGYEALPAALAGRSPAVVICHSLAPTAVVAALREQGHTPVSFAHMPLYDRNPEAHRPYAQILAVSQHVLDSLFARGLTQGWQEPLYGVADLRGSAADAAPIRRTSRYAWDERKFRDRVFGAFEPLLEAVRPHPCYAPRPGVTLGLVSRLTPIKQFPRLFDILAPVLAQHPLVHLEIFGSGGYASVRDLRRALRPAAGQVRFWGHQGDVRPVYAQLDYLLTGLPEKEALGLNVIEAQACGTPVLAVDAPPFTETVADELTGLRYRDPREDEGAAFERLLTRLESRPFRIDASAAGAHLEQFSEAAFAARIGRLVASWRNAGQIAESA